MDVVEQKLEAARRLATSHRDVDTAVEQVFLLESDFDDDSTQPIRLLEVVDGTIERGIEPVGFPAMRDKGIPFSSVIVEISPREYEALRREPFLAFRSEKWTIGTQLAFRK